MVLGNSQDLQQDQLIGLGGRTARSNTYVLAARESRKVSFWLPPLREENLKLENFPNLRIVRKRCHQKHKKLYVKLPNSPWMSLLPLTHPCPPPGLFPLVRDYSCVLAGPCVLSYDGVWLCLTYSSRIREHSFSIHSTVHPARICPSLPNQHPPTCSPS